MVVLGGLAVSYERSIPVPKTRQVSICLRARGEQLEWVERFRTENGSRQGHHLAMTVVFGVRWFDRVADVCGGSSL